MDLALLVIIVHILERVLILHRGAVGGIFGVSYTRSERNTPSADRQSRTHSQAAREAVQAL
jgi:hypothetical protein